MRYSCREEEISMDKNTTLNLRVNAERMTAGQIREKIHNGLEDVESGRFRDLDELLI